MQFVRSLGVRIYRVRSTLARKFVTEVPVFRDLTEMDKVTISNRSIKLFTLLSIYFATRCFVKACTRYCHRHEPAGRTVLD
ncbi:MAG: DNA sulfur modification protein DndB [Vicinamibacterales bacterium]